MTKKHGDFIFQPQNISKEFIEETRTLFTPIVNKQLTDEECIALVQNMVSLEMYLRELKAKYETTQI